MAKAINLFTVPAGRPFLDCVARAVLAGNLPLAGGRPPDPLQLADYTLLLPTRRATRAVTQSFLKAAGGRALILPVIRPIGEADEDLGLIASLSGIEGLRAGPGDVTPAIGELERRMVLTRMVQQWSAAVRAAGGGAESGLPFDAAGAASPAQALRLAAELARLMDMIETEGAGLDPIASLVPDELSAHWQQTLEFLRVLVEYWPAYLAERGLETPARHRNAKIMAEAQRLERMPPAGPVIVAGVTGSIPATAELMRVVAGLEGGAIVLPDLDLELDDAGWQAVAPGEGNATGHPEHPQFGLQRLLERLGATRSNVRMLADSAAPLALQARARLVSQAMRPAATTDRWIDFIEAAKTGPMTGAMAEALAGLELIEAPGTEEEAAAVALILRESIETPGRTAALVSPDRRLARRVVAKLAGMGVDVDDSAGRPLIKTPCGSFLDLVINAVEEDFTPLSVVMLLKHPFARLGRARRDIGFATRALEIAAFRTLYLGRGADAIRVALERAEIEVAEGRRRDRAVTRLWPDDWIAARGVVQSLVDAYAPLTELWRNDRDIALADLVTAHGEVATALAQPAPESTDAELWGREDGEAASLLLASLMDRALPAPSIRPRDYPELYRGLVANENIRTEAAVHPRINIWGPFEARLQRPDVVVLGSLNDGTWPEAADPGPWLNRPMRQSLGMPSPEARLGQSAHDFTSLLGADRVVLTRSMKVDGVPTVASRWLMRIEALAGGLGLSGALRPRQPWLAWVHQRDAISERRSIVQPDPRPPVALRPRRMSVSEVETWIANPYAIYARRVLGVEALPAIGGAPDASLRGSVLHEALSQFTRQFPAQWPADAERRLLDILQAILVGYTGDPRVAAFWVPRLERFARWFAETEPGRRAGVQQIKSEISGVMAITSGVDPFHLTARADRIDVRADGIVITDYKTGAPPSAKKVEAGLAPQLPLEAAIALAGGFAGIDQPEIRALRFIRASGGEPAGKVADVGGADLAALARQMQARLGRLVASYDDPQTPYRAVRRARFSYDYDDYAHLARVGEWGAGGDDDGSADEGSA